MSNLRCPRLLIYCLKAIFLYSVSFKESIDTLCATYLCRNFGGNVKLKNKICLHVHKITLYDLDMKKEENQIRNAALKNEFYTRPRPRSPKAYWGCDTCKLKHVKSVCKLSVSAAVQDKCRVKKTPTEKDDRGLKNQKIKLTDLCDDDKKRIVELIEELSRLVAKNRQLKEKLEQTEKEKQEQQDYLLKQANLFLEEKNFYKNEINEYKIKLETAENEMKNKISQWETHGKEKESEVTYFAKALQKSLKEKSELHEQMNRLKLSLKQSLESFQKLKAELNELQYQEKQARQYASASCQTDKKVNSSSERPAQSEEDTDEEYMSTGNQDGTNTRGGLDFINDKLEYVYRLLRKKGDTDSQSNPQKYDIDLSILLKNQEKIQEKFKQKKQRLQEKINIDETLKEEDGEDDYKFLKPFEQCSKTSLQAERILKTVGKPLNLIINRFPGTGNIISKESARDVKYSNFLQNTIVQKNNIFKSSDDRLCEEDQLLEDLFYSEQSVNLGLDSRLRLDSSRELNKNDSDRPFTW